MDDRGVGWDEGKYGMRHVALIPFGIGLLILFIYYGMYFTSERFRQKVSRQTEEVVAEELTHQNEQKSV